MALRLLRNTLVGLLTLFAGLATSLALAATSPPTSVASAPDATRPMSREQVTRILDSNRQILLPQGVNEQVKLRIGGIDQWVSIRGKDKRNPVLLFLHGGPAAPAMPEAYTFQTPWEDYFTVVQWDQRGAGKTWRANTEQAMTPGMNVASMTDDAAQLVQYLRTRFGKQKIFLLGHSWGSILGVELAQRHPEWFYAYISTGQVVNGRRNEEVGYNFALRQARAEGNATAIRELEAMAPYPGTGKMSLERIGMRSKWEMYYGGLAWGRKDYQFDVDAEELSPDYSRADLDAIDKGSLYSLGYLLEPMLASNFDQVTHFGCPVIVYVGAHDYTTPHELAEEWFSHITAPSKRLVSFADSAHMMMQEQPGRFLVHLITDALPFAQQAGDAAPAEVVRDH
ncbi:alpha/beta fold hydrolase [Silvimonas soli]|uniref:alpha/beta fold hydrolase n=1 Tax=Silvimonas soli TaxID=2980100 RepID=UPI0024B37F33|nr:alpha/beta hydrolase [Silvimonas soli]